MSGTDIATPPGPAQLAARLAPIVISGSATATINRTHLVVATATLSDPTPAEGSGFEVIVRNGTATVGGTAYAAGVKVRRYYHSGAWGNAVEPSQGGTPTTARLTEWDANGNLVNSNIQDGISTSVLTISGTLASNRTWTVPDRADTFAGLATQTFTGVQIFNDDVVIADSGGGINAGSTAGLLRLSGGTASDGAVVVLGGSTHASIPSRGVLRVGGAPSLSWESGWVRVDIAGSASAPSLAMVDAGLGFYRVSANVLGVATSGIDRMRFNSASGIIAFSGNTANGMADVPSPFALGGVCSWNGNYITTGHGAGAAAQARFIGVATGGTSASPTATETGNLAFFRMWGHSGSAYISSGNGFSITARSTWTASSLEASAAISTTPAGSTTQVDRLIAYPDGGVQVGGTYGTSPGNGQLWAQGLAGAVQTVSTTGNIAALDSSVLLTRLTGAAPVVQGIAAPTAGARMIRLWCQNAVTINHEDAAASASNRITSDTGANIAVGAGRTVILIYDTTSARWRPCRWS